MKCVNCSSIANVVAMQKHGWSISWESCCKCFEALQQLYNYIFLKSFPGIQDQQEGQKFEEGHFY